MINVEKQKLKVHIILEDGLAVKGFMYIDQGMRLSDFLNSRKDNFLVITEASLKKSRAFFGIYCHKKVVLFNKNLVKLIEECS